ncbi:MULTISPECIES: Lrp/AsnC family transcriptional regulator [unclassified Leucobacter]|uniref:Lrp/AsnC family transcriptional regulator n=1 Tax=unclassified Leucobacter TaxID=2621730 RepID=UPI00165E278A|nr:AsnC family transcriptional regulator [Leucobacter sp. CX169]MBC9928609.1 AsnC family transcriptional regulator [Leucobacter sp. cx-169]MBC9937540.1 AsnC family transcriptional regulator [Leucobacter sp. cx-87]
MDSLTERSIALLRRDGRASFSDLARQLDTSRMSIANRLNPLFESGALRVFAAVHPRLIGLTMLAHLSIRVSGPTKHLARSLAQLDSPVFVSESTGKYQIIAELHAESLTELQRDVHLIREMPGVIDIDLMLYERILSSLFLGEEPRAISQSFDKSDLVLMELLQRDGRIGYAELGELVGLSASAARSRVARLIESDAMRIGVVRGRTELNSELVFGFGFNLSGDQTALVAHLKAHPGIEFLAQTVGRYDLVATLAFGTQPEFLELFDAVRELPEVRTAESWIHARISLERFHHSTHRLAQIGRTETDPLIIR